MLKLSPTDSVTTSKRSKRTGAGRGFGKPQRLMQPEDMVGFAATIFALQLASERIAELNRSRTAQKWQEFLMEEAAERMLSGETFELLDDGTELDFDD